MKFLGLLISAIFFLINFNGTGLDVVRANYNKVVSDKELCEKMLPLFWDINQTYMRIPNLLRKTITKSGRRFCGKI